MLLGLPKFRPAQRSAPPITPPTALILKTITGQYWLLVDLLKLISVHLYHLDAGAAEFATLPGNGMFC